MVQHSLPAAPPPTTPLAPAPVAPTDTAATATKTESSPMPELTFAELATVPGSTVPENLPPIHPRIDHAPRVIQVIADAARALQDRPIEVTLNPEELGRVRLTLRSVDGSMSVSVAVERPETLDLLRRNIDMLASQLRELGYKDLSFSFASQGESFDRTKDHDSDHQMFAENNPVSPHEAPPQGLMRISVTDTGGIDIRL